MRAVAIAGAVIVFMLAVTLFGDHGLISYYKSSHELTRVKQQAADLEAENQRINQEIELLATDLKLIEQVAREDLGMVKTNEFVIQFSESQTEGRPNPR